MEDFEDTVHSTALRFDVSTFSGAFTELTVAMQSNMSEGSRDRPRAESIERRSQGDSAKPTSSHAGGDAAEQSQQELQDLSTDRFLARTLKHVPTLGYLMRTLSEYGSKKPEVLGRYPSSSP